MVEKLTLGSTHLNALVYCAKGPMIETNMATTDINEQGKQMMRVAASRPGLSQTCMHFSLSGTAQDNQKLTTTDYQQMMREHLEKGQGIDLNKHQYSMFIHKESTGRAHIHCVVNRISVDGNDHNLWNWKTKGKASCRNLEQKYNLEQVTNDRDPNAVKLTSGEIRQQARTGKPTAKQIVKTAVDVWLPHCHTLEELTTALKQDGVTLEILSNKNGPYGCTFTARDPATGKNITLAGGQIADSCKLKQLQKRLLSAEQKQTQQTEGLSPWQNLRTAVSKNIAGCRTLDEFREKLQAAGIACTINNDAISYSVDGETLDARLPRNATLDAIRQRITSNDAWLSVRDAVKIAGRGCLSFEDFREKLNAENVDFTVGEEGELMYTLPDGRTLTGKQIPKNATLDAIRQRLDGNTLRDAIRRAFRDAKNEDEIAEALQKNDGILVGRDDDWKLTYTLPNGRVLSGDAVPRGCTAADLDARFQDRDLYQIINDVLRDSIRDGADVNGVIARLEESGVQVQRTLDIETGKTSITGYAVQEFHHEEDGSVYVSDRTFAGGRVPSVLTAEGIQNRIDSTALWQQVNKTVSNTIREGGSVEAIRRALERDGIKMQIATDPETQAQSVSYSNDKTELTGGQVPQGCTLDGIRERISQRSTAWRGRIAGAAMAAFAARQRREDEDEENEYNRHGLGN